MSYASFRLLVDLTLALTVFADGLAITRADVGFLLHERRLLALSLLSIFVLTPTIALAVVHWVPMPVVARVAIVAPSASILPPLLPDRPTVSAARAYAVGLTLVVCVLAVAVIPAQADLLGRIAHHPYSVAPGIVARYVGLLLILPLVLAIASARAFPSLKRLGRPLHRVAAAVTAVTIVVQLILIIPQLGPLLKFGPLLGMTIFNICALAIGHLEGGPDRDRAVVLGLASASRHPAIAITIASANYAGERFSAAVILCVIINTLTWVPYVQWQRRHALNRVAYPSRTSPRRIARAARSLPRLPGARS